MKCTLKLDVAASGEAVVCDGCNRLLATGESFIDGIVSGFKFAPERILCYDCILVAVNLFHKESEV